MTAEEYRALLDVDFNNVKIEDLTDIRKIKIDKNQPQSKRQAQFLKQVGNPYMLRRGSMMIKVSFANNGLSMEQAFENLLLNVFNFGITQGRNILGLKLRQGLTRGRVCKSELLYSEGQNTECGQFKDRVIHHYSSFI